MRGLAALVLGGIMIAWSAGAKAQSGDGTFGARIVQENCVACHSIGTAFPARDAASKAPDLVAVANLPSTTELSIKVFLRSSHRSMPNFILSGEEVDSITAYILGLKTR